MVDHLSIATLLWWSAKGSAIVLLAIVMTALLRRQAAALRHAVWATAVVSQLVIPFSDAFVPKRTFAVNVPMRTFPMTNFPATPTQLSVRTSQTVESRHRQSAPFPIGVLLRLAAVVVVLLSLLRLAAGTLQIWRIERNATSIGEGPWSGLLARERQASRGRRIRLLVSSRIELPMSWGIFRPAILLPMDAPQWPAALRRHVLLHELGHVRRGDALTQCLGQLVAALFWFNPLVGLAVRRMRFESENACDDYVLRDGASPSVYARTLLTLSIGRRFETIPAFAAVAMARRSELERRIRALIHPLRDSSVRQTSLAVTLAAAILLVLPLAAIQRASPVIPPLHKRWQAALPQSAACRPLLVPDAHFSQTSGELTRDGRTTYYFFERPSSERCIEGSFNRDVRFTDDDLDLVPAPGLDVLVRERTSGMDRAVTVTTGSGQLRYRFLRNGRLAAWDEEARNWYRAMLPEFVRRTYAGADARVRRLLAQEGVPGVLSEISRIPDGDVRGFYLLELTSLRTPAQLPRQKAIFWAATSLRGDEASFGRFLAALAGREGEQPEVRAAILSSVEALHEPSNRKVVLEGMAASPDRAARAAALGAIALLPDSAWRRLLLEDTAEAFLSDPALVTIWRTAAGTIEQSEDRRMLVATLRARGIPTPAVAQ